MISIERINAPHEIAIGGSPNVADMAIASIDDGGNIGSLNSYVLREYGYSVKDLPPAERLMPHGFDATIDNNKKSILFVVTVSEEETRVNLEKNLYAALAEFRAWIWGRKIWVPLMGTGTGGLSIEESYYITVRTINRFLENYKEYSDAGITSFILSLPGENEDARMLLDTINNDFDNIKDDIGEVIKVHENNFYLVGASWNGEDKTDEFYNKGIWETGYEEKFSILINDISKNSILIIKSTYQAGGIGYLRIKAIGVVTDNINNGTTLKVDWRIKGLSIDIEHMGSYRSTIHIPSSHDVVTIFSSIPIKLWENIFIEKDKKPDKRKDHIASLLSDTDAGTDYLDISKDVNAFAKVMTARTFTPPLAIALFGKWGSGKSFFMRKLRDRISALSAITKHDSYCKGIAQIHFNAWSYMDANLWASIVTRIFEGLNEYLNDNTKAGIEKSKIEEELNKQLTISKEEVDLLEKHKETVSSQLTILEKERNKLSAIIGTQIQSIRARTFYSIVSEIDNQFRVKEKLISALQSNNSFKKNVNELKEIIPDEYLGNPNVAYKKIKSIHTFLTDFFRPKKILWNLLWIACIIYIVSIIPITEWAIRYNIKFINFTLSTQTLYAITVVCALGKRWIDTYKRLQPIISSFWKIKVNYESEIEKAKAQFEQDEKALKFEIENNKSKLQLIDKEIQQNKAIKSDLEFKIKQALSTEALYTFIEKRSNSEEYKKHLGIISLIRKDFEILNGLFTDHKTELSNIKPEESEKFKQYFDKPLERIILYIDDLDRCPEETVVQVLEAVNLLMAFPLFIVVVGVDPRWVKNALVKKHYLQFASKVDGHEENNFKRIEPTNYLEKIFQIPFCLKTAGDDGVKNMIRKLAETDIVANATTGLNSNIISNQPRSEERTTGEQLTSDNDDKIGQSQQITSRQPDSVTNIIYDNPETIRLTDNEIKLLEDMSVIIGDNPRAIKRFVNTYRIIKAHDDFNYDTTTDDKDALVIMFLLALPIGKYRELYNSFEAYINDYKNDSKLITFYLQQSYKLDNDQLNVSKNDLYVAMLEKSSYHTLGNTVVERFKTHNSFIKRFTFNN